MLPLRIRGRLATIVIVALFAGLAGCGDDADLPVHAESLRESLPKLEEAAAQWMPDAYLVDASVELLSGDSSRWLASGAFQSPSEDSQGILLLLEQDGSIQAEVVPQPNGVRQVQPITQDDWTLDSEEALEHALTEEGRRYLEENPDSQCSFMYLERDVRSPDQPVVWRLTLAGCLLEPVFETVVIDANSGAVIRRRTYE